VVLLLAAVENVFPPVPADTAVALGAFVSGGGRVSALVVFIITLVGNVGAAAGVYSVARHYGRSFFQGRIGRRLLSPEGLTRLEHLYHRFGLWGIFFSRFIPGVRAVVPPFAGIAGLAPLRAIPPMAVASAIWYGAITWLAATAVANLGDLEALVRRMNRGALLAGLAVVLLLLALWLVRRAGQGRP